jgi:23S rRNA pseudouridine1911/1915/1917 synthase
VASIKIIYEDNHLLVVEKPINVAVQKDSSNDLDLQTMLKDYLKEKYNKAGNVYLGIVHRLDRPVGGVMVFAKTSKAASRLSEQVRNNQLKKEYYAVVENKFDEKEGTYKDLIEKLDNGNSKITPNGKEAELDYLVVEEKDGKSLVKVNLKTGRHHQIRVQFKYHGHPLCGDQRYNKQDKTQIALYAHSLSFNHPVTKELMSFTSVPRYGYFKDFNIK